MDTRRKPVSMAVECLDMFHGTDQTAFKMLTQILHRDVTQSLMVIAFLLSLETIGLSGLLQNATVKESWFMNSLAEDCVICLQCLLHPMLAGVVEKHTKLETLSTALKIEVTVSQVHGMRSVLLPLIPESLSNPTRLLGFKKQDEGTSVALEDLSRHNNAQRIHMQQGRRQTQQEKGKQKYVCKELDDEERPKTLTVCFGQESMPTAEAIAEFFSNLFGQVVHKVTGMPRRDKDSGDFAFVLFNDASIPRIIMGDKKCCSS